VALSFSFSVLVPPEKKDDTGKASKLKGGKVMKYYLMTTASGEPVKAHRARSARAVRNYHLEYELPVHLTTLKYLKTVKRYGKAIEITTIL